MEILYAKEEQEELQALFTKKMARGKGNNKGKIPIKYFNYKKVGHHVAKFSKPIRKKTNDWRENKN